MSTEAQTAVTFDLDAQLGGTLTASTAQYSDDSNNAILTDTILKSIYIIIGSASLLGNGSVLAVFFSSASMRTQLTGTFIINQSIVDGLAGLFLILVTISEDDGRYLSGLADEIYCRAWLTNAPLWALLLSSSFNLIAITLERFISVWKPIWHKTSFTRSTVAVFLVSTWIIGPSFTFIYGSLASIIIEGKCYAYGIRGTRSLILGSLLIFLQYVLPVLVFTVCYSAIALILHQKQKQLQQESSSKAAVSRNIIKTLALVCLCFAVCWSTNQVYYFMYMVGYQIDFSSPLYHISVVMVFMNCCCNPFVYILKYKEFQKKLKRLISCKRGRIQPETTEISLNTS